MSDGAKRDFYQRSDVVSRYDEWRFGGPGGAYVNQRELQAVTELLSAVATDAKILDLPCGTGRLSEHLLRSGYRNITCADFSPEMIQLASERLPTLRFSREDALRTTFAPASFDAIVCLRFSFHTPDLDALLREFTRILKPGGVVIFDVLRWSPRTLVPGLDRRLGGRLWTWGDRQVQQAAEATGLEGRQQRPMFLLPSFAYRHFPGFVVSAVHACEARLPASLLSKKFWCLRLRTQD